MRSGEKSGSESGSDFYNLPNLSLSIPYLNMVNVISKKNLTMHSKLSSSVFNTTIQVLLMSPL